MLEIYTIAGGDWLRGNLNAIAAFHGDRHLVDH
jgi:conjugal transfer mating pair stabilization protein TraG